jgi:hypothetical protein
MLDWVTAFCLGGKEAMMDENLLARLKYKGPKFNVDPSIYGSLPTFAAPPVQTANFAAPLPVQAPMLFQARPQQEDDGGWAGALGQIGASLLSRILSRRQATPQEAGHTSSGHLD